MFAQNGTVTGTILDKEFNNEPLPFANIVIKGTKQGTSTNENGKYSISLKPGNYILVIGYLGYETKEIPFTIKANEKKVINHTLEASCVQLNDVEIVQTVSKEKESALLQEQQKAVEIKQSIGAEEISRKGVNDVANAVAKVSGVSKQDDSGNVFVRGLPSGGQFQFNPLQIDGMPVLSTFGLNSSAHDVYFRTDIGMKSLEFVRGGSSVLHGAGSVAGIINYTSETGSAVSKNILKVETGNNSRYKNRIYFRNRYYAISSIWVVVFSTILSESFYEDEA